jgi:outer membrane immunogenic protein
LSAVIVALPAAAYADDFAGRFSGFYIGANAGGAWGRSRFATDPGCPNDPASAVFCNAPPDASAANGSAVAASGTGKLSSSGFTGGAQAGLSWQTGAFVYGAEGDFGAMHLRKSAAANGVFPLPFAGTQYTVTESLSADWLATLRGRLGFTVTPQLLVYVTGGAAFTRVEFASSYADNAIDPLVPFPGGTGSGSKSQFKTGWTLGGGLQWALNRYWSVKAEYLYADFGSVSIVVPLSNTAAFTQTMLASSDLAVHLVRFGVDYRF